MDRQQYFRQFAEEAKLSWNSRQDRIRAIFGVGPGQPLPKVNIDTLLTYRKHLQAMFGGNCFQAIYYGVQQQQVFVVGFPDEVDPSLGVLCELCGESLMGQFPVHDIEIGEDRSEWESLEDYRHWFNTCRRP